VTNPFEAPGEWVRCALHTHSTESDGTVPPWALAEAYRDAGFDAVAITDHWRLTEVTSPGLIAIPSAELCYDLDRPGPIGEFLAYGIDHIPEDPGGDRANWFVNERERYEQRTFPSLSEGAAWVASRGGVTYAAHPYWSGLPTSALREAEGVAGLEVFNGSAEVECGRGDSSPWWDDLLQAGRSAFAIAVDDQHLPLFELGLAWTMARVRERSVAGVLEALRTGAAYASAGPAIHAVGVEGRAIEVSCSPVRAVIAVMEEERGVSVVAGERGRRMGRVVSTNDAGLITGARLEWDWPDTRYRRIVVVDAAGARAWTNPL
jgi:hypothetical protein